MRRVIFNQKGGVGKTTITCNLAAVSAASGKRTLVLDLDPQGNSTRYLLGAQTESLEITGAELFEDMLSVWPRHELTHCVHTTRFAGLDVLPSHPSLAELQDRLESRYKMYKLKEAITAVEGVYDEIFIDTPPAMEFYTRSALIAADSWLIPFDCADFSRRALYALLDSVRELQQDHNANLTVEGIIVNQFQARAKLPERLVRELVDEGLPILQPSLSASVKIRESHERAMPMVHYLPSHKITAQFQELFRAIQPAQAKKNSARRQAAGSAKVTMAASA